MPTDFRSLIADGRVHVFDGAMGTMLYGKGFFLNVCYDELNIKQPRLVQEVHAEYVRAGAEILETNTFGANPLKLNSYGLADDTEKINRTAAELARAAAARSVPLASASSPLARPRKPKRKHCSLGRCRACSPAAWTASCWRRSATCRKCTRR